MSCETIIVEKPKTVIVKEGGLTAIFVSGPSKTVTVSPGPGKVVKEETIKTITKGIPGTKGDKGDPGDFNLNNFRKYVDISTQIDAGASKDTFTVPDSGFIHLAVLLNGRDQTQCIIGTTLTTFTLAFIPNDGQHLAIRYDVP